MKNNTTVSLKEVALDGEFKKSDDSSFSAKATLEINNAATFDTFAFLRHEPEMWISGGAEGDPLGAASKFSELDSSVALLGSVSWSNRGTGQTCFSGYGPYKEYESKTGGLYYWVEVDEEGRIIAMRYSYTASPSETTPPFEVTPPNKLIYWTGDLPYYYSGTNSGSYYGNTDLLKWDNEKQTFLYREYKNECRGDDPLGAEQYLANIASEQYSSPAQQISDAHVSYSPGNNYSPNDYTYYYARVRFADFETAESFAKAKLTVTLDLALEGYPNSKAVITADRNKVKGGDLSMNLIRDGRTTTYRVSVNADNPMPETLKVSNLDKVMLELTRKDDQLSGHISVEGKQIGAITQTGDGLFMVRYQDDSFETLQ